MAREVAGVAGSLDSLLLLGGGVFCKVDEWDVEVYGV